MPLAGKKLAEWSIFLLRKECRTIPSAVSARAQSTLKYRKSHAIIGAVNRNIREGFYMKISIYLSGAVRQFSYWFVHGTLGYPTPEGIDYLNELDEDGSCMEQAFLIFMSNMELDNEGNLPAWYILANSFTNQLPAAPI